MATLVPALNASSEDDFRARAAVLRRLRPPWVQVDVSDGILGVPRNFASPERAAELLSGIRLDIHLMVEDAAAGVSAWESVRPARLTVHVEARGDLRALLAHIARGGSERGLALGPETDVRRVESLLADTYFLLFVAVPPGRSGQPFDPQTFERVRSVRERAPALNIGVDGGVTADLIPRLRETGVTTICAASAILDAPDPRAAYEELKRLAEA